MQKPPSDLVCNRSIASMINAESVAFLPVV